MESATITSILIIIAAWMAYRNLAKPSNNRQWAPFHSRLPYFECADGNTLFAHNIRSARYRQELTDYDLKYSDDTFKISELKQIWFIVESYKLGQAHTFLSLEFNDGRFLTVSVEVRKTNPEDFSAWMVSVKNFEIFYILADEQDVLYLRTNLRKNPVFLYPLKFSRGNAQKILKSIVKNINKWHNTPQFYRVFTKNCTSIPFKHLRDGCPKLPKFNWRYILTSQSDTTLYKAGLLDTGKPLSEIRKQYYVTEKAQKLQCNETFSKKIRE